MKTPLYPSISGPETQADRAPAQGPRPAGWRGAVHGAAASVALLAAGLSRHLLGRENAQGAVSLVEQPSPVQPARLQRCEADRAVGQRFLQGGD